jgi:hypothetical protein
VLHFVHNNQEACCLIHNIDLPMNTVKRDLGVIIQDNLEVSEQCAKAVKCATKVLGMIGGTFILKN